MSTRVSTFGRFGAMTIAAAAMAMTFGTTHQAEATSLHWSNGGYSIAPTQSASSLLAQFRAQGGSFGSSASASASASASTTGGTSTVIRTSTSGGGSASASASASTSHGSSSTSSVAPVPLPAGGALLLAGLGAFAAVRRRNTAA